MQSKKKKAALLLFGGGGGGATQPEVYGFGLMNVIGSMAS